MRHCRKICFFDNFAYSGVMTQFPSTSQEHYLTGQAALNIPNEDGSFADWHFTEVFLSGRGRFPIAGENFPDTTELLGSYGIRECAGVLRRFGLVLGEGEKVYAANHVRAVLDLVVKTLSKGRIPEHVTIEDILDTPEGRRELQEQLHRLKERITDRVTLSLLEQWEQQQH